MGGISSERPHFFEGQYIGASDVATLQEHATERASRHALGAHSWGIAMGLDLVEQVSDAGDIQLYVLPGLAWDGYGRQIAVLSPMVVAPGLIPAGSDELVDVWIAYHEAPGSGLRPGFGVCDANDEYARVRESCTLVIGRRRRLVDRVDGISLGGEPVADPREVWRHFDDSRGLALDASVPHQCPRAADDAAWLVPIGKLRWDQATGRFLARDPAQLRESRAARRYAGVVAQDVFASDGVIRLRDRETPTDGVTPADSLAATAAVQVTDFTDGDEPTFDELVWVEGNLRVTGDARLWGTRLEVRDRSGGDEDVPLWLRRGPTAGLGDGRDLEVALGLTDSSEGHNRLVIGTVAVDSPGPDETYTLTPRVVATDDGRVGIGTGDPAAYADLADNLVVKDDGAAGVSVISGPQDTGALYFGTGTSASEEGQGRITYYHGDTKLALAVDGEDHLWLTGGPHVGIGTDDPASFLNAADDLVVASDANTGITIKSAEEATGRLHFARGTGSADGQRGYLSYDHEHDRMQLGTNASTRVTITQAGDVGIGTVSPDTALHIKGADPDLTLDIDSGSTAKWAELRFAVDRVTRSQLYLDKTNSRTYLTNDGQFSVVAQGSRVAIGHDEPVEMLHIKGADPDIRLDVVAGSNTPPALQYAVDGTVKSELYLDVNNERTYLSNAGADSLVLDGDRVGVGTDAPASMLHVRGNDPDLTLDSTSGNFAHIRFQGNGTTRGQIYARPATSRLLLGGGASAVLAVGTADVGIGLGDGAATCRLHVRDAISGNAADLDAHVALIENTAGGGSDVLALRVGNGAADDGNNFITCFAGAAAIGRIEATPAGGGIRLRSGGADFAEWMAKRDPDALFQPGDVVGVREGLVSHDTTDADYVVAVTDRSIVSGNAPAPADEPAFAEVTLVGQLPVRVRGPVVAGDLLVASGQGDGVARAVPEARLDLRLAARVVGRATASCKRQTERRVACTIRFDPWQGAVLARLAEALSARADSQNNPADGDPT